MEEKNLDLELQKIENKISLLKRKEKTLLLQKNKQSRKERTRRLIQTGALAEKYMSIEHLTIEEKEEVFKMFSSYINDKLPQKYKRSTNYGKKADD
ncbi:hypothetical protein HCJ46_17155 [Listeria booriae]|uniref:hypothetical protein n=1 Tax=Listeria booriae TaxID=1552123 RepID=UPI0016252F2B|nr:hypothetical protein [Listeria booriae]MBC1920482.1 hypothetical protein [Listeria booriae]